MEFIDSAFIGLDATSAPESLPAGVLTQADNVFVDGGALRSRPGKRAQLSAALGKTIGMILPFRRADGSAHALFVAGTGASGLVYRWAKGATTASVVTNSGSVTFDATTAQLTRLGDYIFITGANSGNAGKLYRYNILTDAVEADASAGLGAFTRSVTASTGFGLLAAIGVGTWSADYCATPTMTLPDYEFAASSSGNPPSSTYWDYNATAVEVESGNIIDPVNFNLLYARLDVTQDFIQTKAAILTPTKANSGGIGSATRYAMHYSLAFRWRATTTNDSLKMTIIGYSDTGGTTELARLSQTIKATQTTSAENKTLYFSFVGACLDTQLKSVRVRVDCMHDNPGTNGPYVTRLTIGANENTGASTGLIRFTQTNAQQTVTMYGADGVNGLISISGENRLTVGVSSLNLSTVSRISIPVTRVGSIKDFGVKLGLRTGLTTAAANSDQMTFSTANGQEYLTVDLTTIDASSRTGINYLDFYFVTDVSSSTDALDGSKGIILGDLLFSGNLTIGQGYTYRVREIKSAGTLSEVAGSASGFSATITPTTTQARGVVVIGGSGTLPDNSGALLEVYRRGGLVGTDDTYYRRVLPPFDPSTNQSYWNATTRTFTDDIPDASLFLAPLLDDHDATPFSSTVPARAAAAFRGQVVIGTDTGIYVSRLETGARVGLYWSLAPDRASAYVELLGWTGKVRGTDGSARAGGDSVQALIPFQSRLWVMFQSSIYLLSGSDCRDFVLRRWENDGGRGAIAPRACGVNAGRLWYLATDGLRATDGASVDIVSMPVQKLLAPAASFGQGLNASAFATCALWFSSNRVFISAPLPAQSSIGATYVMEDTGSMGARWYRWLLGTVTAGAVFGGAGDSEDIVIGDSGGQIYQLGPSTGDTTTSGGSVAAVTVTVASRRFQAADALLRAERIGFSAACADNSWSATIGVNNQSSLAWSLAYSLTAGENTPGLIPVGQQIKGNGLYWTFSAATTNPLTLREVVFRAVERAKL